MRSLFGRRLRRLLPLALVAALLPAAKASGSVVLALSPTSTSVARGGTVNLTVNLTSNGGEATTGVDYFLKASAPGVFTITSRNLSTSPYGDPQNLDPVVLASPSANLSNTRSNSSGNVLNSNGTDLGDAASEQPGGSAQSPVTYLVAIYTLSVSSTATAGPYTIQTYSDPGAGYSGGAAQSFDAFDFNGQGSTTLTVTVPEPTGLALAALGCVGLLARRRRA